MSKKEKPDGRWGRFDVPRLTEPEPEDHIQKLIDEKEQMIKDKAPKEELQQKEKEIWDEIYKKRVKKMLFG